jgi:hypothetical protein
VTAEEPPTRSLSAARPIHRLGTSHEQRGDARRAPWSSTIHLARWVPWIAFPTAGMLWVGSRSDRAWFVDDEWLMIGRAASGSWLHKMLAGFGGHLFALPYWVYRAQISFFGVESHWFVYAVFCGSLAALQLSVGAMLWRLGIPTVLALLAGSVVAYFGPGAQTMSYTAQFPTNLAFALSFTAGFIALRKDVRRGSAVAVAVILIAAFAMDSGSGSVGIVFVATLVAALWPRRLALLAMTPPVAAIISWQLIDRSGRESAVPAPLGESARFALHLTGRAAGGLIGDGRVAGWIFLPVAIVIVGVGLARAKLSRPVVACFVGGMLAAGAAVAGIVYTRAGYVPVADLGGSRFVQQVAVVLLVAFLPALAATLRPVRPASARLLAAAAAAGLIVIFILNLGSLWPHREFWEAWSANTKLSVRRSVYVVAAGCGNGNELNLRGLPVRAEGSDPYEHIPVQLLRNLLDQGALTRAFGIRPTRTAHDAICTPPRQAPGTEPR